MKVNFAEEIEKSMKEPIIAVVISADKYNYHVGPDSENERIIDSDYLDRPLPWIAAKELLNYEYDNGYGGVDCHSVSIYTENFVGFVVCYDGSSWIAKISRNPVNHIADVYGGG